MLIVWILLGSMFLGLILLVTGVSLLRKLKGNLAGILVTGVGLVFIFVPLALFLFQMINVRIQS